MKQERLASQGASSRVAKPQPVGPPSTAPCTFAPRARGGLRRAVLEPGRRLDRTVVHPRSRPAATLPPRLPRGCALRPRPPHREPRGEHAVLPIRGTATGRPLWHLGRLVHRGEVAGVLAGPLTSASSSASAPGSWDRRLAERVLPPEGAVPAAPAGGSPAEISTLPDSFASCSTTKPRNGAAFTAAQSSSAGSARLRYRRADASFVPHPFGCFGNGSPGQLCDLRQAVPARRKT